jgi:hypothetical protein
MCNVSVVKPVMSLRRVIARHGSVLLDVLLDVLLNVLLNVLRRAAPCTR